MYSPLPVCEARPGAPVRQRQGESAVCASVCSAPAPGPAGPRPRPRSPRGTRFVGVWGRRPEAAKELAGRHRTRAYDDVDALLADVDAVAVALPPDVQAQLAVRAAGAGCHLLLDKPVATTVTGARAVVRADGAEVASVVFFTTRFVSSPVPDRRQAAAGGWFTGHAQWLGDVFHAASESPFGHALARREGRPVGRGPARVVGAAAGTRRRPPGVGRGPGSGRHRPCGPGPRGRRLQHADAQPDGATRGGRGGRRAPRHGGGDGSPRAARTPPRLRPGRGRAARRGPRPPPASMRRRFRPARHRDARGRRDPAGGQGTLPPPTQLDSERGRGARPATPAAGSRRTPLPTPPGARPGSARPAHANRAATATYPRSRARSAPTARGSRPRDDDLATSSPPCASRTCLASNPTAPSVPRVRSNRRRHPATGVRQPPLTRTRRSTVREDRVRGFLGVRGPRRGGAWGCGTTGRGPAGLAAGRAAAALGAGAAAAAGGRRLRRHAGQSRPAGHRLPAGRDPAAGGAVVRAGGHRGAGRGRRRDARRARVPARPAGADRCADGVLRGGF